MGFFNFFRPGWQNSNVNVRKEAVIKLQNGEQAAIETVAQTDANAEIRGIAIRKLESTDILQKILSAETDASNKREAENRLNDRLAFHLKNFNGSATQKERDAVSQIAKTRFADDLLKSMPNDELRKALAEASTRQSSLEFVALKDSALEVALAALSRIEREGMLQNISKNSRHTEVRKKAQERLRKKQDSENRETAEKNDAQLLLHKREALVQQAQRLADSPQFMTNKAEFDKILQMAEELGMDSEKSALDRVIESYNNRRAEEQARLDKLQAESEEKAAKQKRLESLLSEMDSLIESGAMENAEKIESLIAQFKAENGSAETPLSGLFLISVERFNRIAKKEADIAAHGASRAEILAKLKLLADVGDDSKSTEHKVKALVRAWESLPLVDGANPELQVYNTLRNQFSEKFNARNSEEEKTLAENSAKLKDIIDGVKAIDENGEFKIISQKLRDFYKRWKEIVGDNKFRYKDLWNEYREATSRFKEMQEWESWHNENDREALLEEMSALAQADADKETLAKLRGFASQWKSIGPVSAARLTEFREKFHTLFDEILAKCEPFVKEQEEERKQNLAAKEEICSQVEALSNESDANWRDKYKSMQELQEKWKTIGMVPKENVQPLWDRFRAAENAFYAKHKEFVKQEDVVREENYQKKILLCEKAEKLSESSDWNATSAALRNLQNEWKEAGPVPRAKSEEIWNRFRIACDAFFNRKRAHFEELDSAKAKNLEAKEALCAKLETLDLDSPESASIMESAEEEWQKLGMVPKDKVEEIRNRFNAILDKFAAQKAKADPEFQKAVDAAKVQKESIISTISSLIDSAGSNESVDTVKNLQSEWKSLPRCGAEEQALYQKFREACDEFFSRRRDQMDIQEQARENNLQNKLRLCEEAERLLENLTEDNRRESMNEVKQLRRHWRDIGAVPRREADKIWQRFNTACDKIFGKKSESEPEA